MTDKNASAGRVQDAVERLGATITTVTDQGEVDFRLDDIGGFARERRGTFRASFYIAQDPDAAEAERFVAAHDALPYGEAQFAQHNNGSIIRLLVELPFDKGQDIWTTAQTARALHAAWLSRHEGSADLLSTLGAAGVALPPLGSISESEIHTYGAWSWGSRYVPPFLLYIFAVEPVARQVAEHGPFFALAHAGHGINSYGLNLVTAAGPVAAYVQHGYGGGYSNPVHDLIDINATYSRLNVLLRAAATKPADEIRWLMVYSQFRVEIGIIDLDKVRRSASLERATDILDSEPELFESLVQRLGLDNFDLGTGGSVSW